MVRLWSRRLLVTGVIALSLVTTAAAPAQAGRWRFVETFDNQQTVTQNCWFEHPNDYNIGSYEWGYSPSGQLLWSLAQLSLNEEGWMSINRSVLLPQATAGLRNCAATAVVRATIGTPMQLEFINP